MSRPLIVAAVVSLDHNQPISAVDSLGTISEHEPQMYIPGRLNAHECFVYDCLVDDCAGMYPIGSVPRVVHGFFLEAGAGVARRACS